MKRLLVTTCALAALTGFAIAQSSTGTGQAPAPTAPAAAPPASTTQPPGVRRVDETLTKLTITNYYTVNPADMRASKIMGKTVYNLNNENIGEVNDLIIDNGKTIKAIVIGVGGFLGIGERNVAIQPGAIMLSETSDGSARLVVNTTKDDLKNAPAFTLSDVDKAGPNAGSTTGTTPATK